MNVPVVGLIGLVSNFLSFNGNINVIQLLNACFGYNKTIKIKQSKIDN